jgi:hypothetical protein
MTQQEWLMSTRADDLLRFIEPNTSDRKLHYYAIACARRITLLLPHPASLEGIDLLERFVEGKASEEELLRVSYHVEGAAFCFDYVDYTGSPTARKWIQEVGQIPRSKLEELINDPQLASAEPREILKSAAYMVDADVSPTPFARRASDWAQSARSPFHSVPLLRDIFGNPFRPVAFEPEWRSDTAVSLAKHIYEARDFAQMPILADALQDAGCDNTDILSHCRDPQQTHVRGCWVVDMILGNL